MIKRIENEGVVKSCNCSSWS